MMFVLLLLFVCMAFCQCMLAIRANEERDTAGRNIMIASAILTLVGVYLIGRDITHGNF